MKKTVLLIVGGAAGCLVAVLIVVASIVLVGARAWNRLETKQCNSAETFIRRYVPPSAKVVAKYDDHGGIHGDGTLWQVHQLSGQARADFEAGIEKDPDWKALPLPEELKRLSSAFRDAFPHDLSKGRYFFYDFQPEWYPQHETNKKPVWDRPSINFIIILYDPETGTIYVDNEDS